MLRGFNVGKTSLGETVFIVRRMKTVSYTEFTKGFDPSDDGDLNASLYLSYRPSGSSETKIKHLPARMTYEDFMYIQQKMFENEPEEALKWLIDATEEELDRAILMGKLSGQV